MRRRGGQDTSSIRARAIAVVSVLVLPLPGPASKTQCPVSPRGGVLLRVSRQVGQGLSDGYVVRHGQRRT